MARRVHLPVLPEVMPMPTHHHIEPNEALRFLEGVAFPAPRGALLDHVRRAEAPPSVRQLLQRIPDRSYRSSSDVAEAMRHVEQAPPRAQPLGSPPWPPPGMPLGDAAADEMAEPNRDLRDCYTAYECRDRLPDLAGRMPDEELKLIAIWKKARFEPDEA